MKTIKSPQNPRGTLRSEQVSFNLLQANDFMAESIRKEMEDRNILLINLTSSAGSGKTTLLKETANRLRNRLNMKVLVGDIETERDADELKKAGIDALQIVTGGICHLEAQMIRQGAEQLNLEGVDVLFIENVGNLVCPASYDLGEDYRVTLLAVTEGHDKPKKYPKMFLTSDLVLISKMDLIPYLPFSVTAAEQDAHDVNPDVPIIPVSALSGAGMETWCEWLVKKVVEKKGSVPAESWTPITSI